MSVQGIDVSTSQGTIHWGTVRQAGIRFAYIKATEGLQQDSHHAARAAYFQANWPEMRDAGLLRGAYHFFRANLDSELQAETFVEAMGALEDDDLPPMLDVETDDGADDDMIRLRVHRCLAKIKEETGITPLLYANASFYNAHLDDTFGDFPLWIASYGANKPTGPTVPHRKPTLPSSRDSFTIWQYGSQGSVPGIGVHVDLDLFQGSFHALKAFSQSMRG